MPRPKQTPREQFEEFHAAHPDVYVYFDYYCLRLIAGGVKLFGAPFVWELVRYETLVQTGETPYKLPNQLRPYYAREFQRLNPELAHHLRTRTLRSEVEQEAA